MKTLKNILVASRIKEGEHIDLAQTVEHAH